MLLNPATMQVRARQAAPRRIASANVNAVESASVVANAHRCLRATGYFGVRTPSCEHHEGVLVLRGQVSSYYQKQAAQEAVRRLPGVDVIINAVDVVSPSQSERRPSTATDDFDTHPI